MAAKEGIFSKDTFQFFRDLGKYNKKEWMDAHRDRYQESVVRPLKRLLAEMGPAVLKLNPQFETTGRRGVNFSRINRDIRFAKDKTLYKTNMYVKFPVLLGRELESGELYAGVSADVATAGFRIYGGSKRKQWVLALVAESRIARNPRWLAQQKKKLARKYESYWYSAIKGDWKSNHGWPKNEDWQGLQAWVVRKKISPAAATRPSYPAELAKIFRDVYPILKFVSIPD